MGSGKIQLQTDKGIEDLTPYVRKFVYKNSLLTGHARWKLWYDTSQWDFWKNFMIGNGLRFTVRFTGQRDGKVSESPWLNLVVDQSKGDLQSTYLQGLIEGGGPELAMMNFGRRRAYVNVTASQVLQRIAVDHALQPDIAASSDIDFWYQTNEPDWTFMQEILKDYVPSANNRGDAYLNVSEQSFSVKAINFAAPSVRKFDLTQGDDRIPKVKYRYYGGQVARRGVVVEARGFDRDTGLAVVFTASPQSTPGAALADKAPQRTTDKKKVVVLASGSLGVIRNCAVRTQAKYSQRYFGVEISVLNDFTMRLRDMVEISMKDSEGNGAFTEGRYGVYEYLMVYSTSKIYTKVVGYRQEAYTGPVPATGAPVSRSSGADPYRLGSKTRQPTLVTAVPLGS